MGAIEFIGLSDHNILNAHVASLLKILIKVGYVSIFTFQSMYIIGAKVAKKPTWVLP